jgi:hypothetical protein
MQKYAGGCQCGSIRYRISGPLGSADICHCRMCQKAFGSWGAALLRVDLKHFSWTRGKPANFKSSAKVDRGFCQNCGTPLYMFEHGDPFIDLAMGTLDDPNIAKLASQIGVESKVSWFDTMHLLPVETTEQNRAAQQPEVISLQHPDHETDK